MRKNLQLPLLSGCLFFILFLSCTENATKQTVFDMQDAENLVVLIELQSEKTQDLDSLTHANEVKAVVGQIREGNAKLGFEKFEKKMASFSLETNGRTTTYLTIRSFEDYPSAALYAENIAQELDKEVYGTIAEPFPISQSNYQSCVGEKSFKSYYKAYKRSISKG